MKRDEFLKLCLSLGIGASFPILSSCSQAASNQRALANHNFSGKVIIIGAGSAGLMAGYWLNQHNVDFTILEASSRFGGRVKKIEGFADFPIDLGAEWIHTEPEIFSELLNQQGVENNIETIEYDPQTYLIWADGKLKPRNYYKYLYSEYKFKNSTWYDFFDQYVEPEITAQINYNQQVTEIDYSGSKIKVKTADDQLYLADKVILTVPLTILKQEQIEFTPSLGDYKTNALSKVDMPDGIKMFFKFSQRFYPDMTLDGGILDTLSEEDGDKAIYDAAFKKDSNMNILGLFAVGLPATAYASQSSDQKSAELFLAELDQMFSGKASEYYQGHLVQNWTKEPYILGSYSHYQDYEARDTIAKSIDNKLYFAGEAVAAYDDLSTVHGAGQSGINAVNKILQSV